MVNGEEELTDGSGEKKNIQEWTGMHFNNITRPTENRPRGY